jgi:ribosomal protein S18
MDPDFASGNRRLFKPKETYVPRDLNDRFNEEYIKKSLIPVKKDLLKELNIDPLMEYKNTMMLTHFITEMGHIKPSTETGLCLQNQKKVAKAIKRCRAMGKCSFYSHASGLLPYTYRLPIEEARRFKFNKY